MQVEAQAMVFDWVYHANQLKLVCVSDPSCWVQCSQECFTRDITELWGWPVHVCADMTSDGCHQQQLQCKPLATRGKLVPEVGCVANYILFIIPF